MCFISIHLLMLILQDAGANICKIQMYVEYTLDPRDVIYSPQLYDQFRLGVTNIVPGVTW